MNTGHAFRSFGRAPAIDPARTGRTSIRAVMAQEWRLQWRSWGTWVMALFVLAVVVSQHAAFERTNFGHLDQPLTAAMAAGNWADRTAIGAIFMVMFTVPFVLDRLVRTGMSAVELCKPFDDRCYVLGKALCAVTPVAAIVLLGAGVHLGITMFRVPGVGLGQALAAYAQSAALIVIPAVAFAAAATFCLSVFLPALTIPPLYLAYLTVTTIAPGAGERGFSWAAALVRPEYFDGWIIPAARLPEIILHQLVYLLMAAGLLLVSVLGFRRARFLARRDARSVGIVQWLRRTGFPGLPGLGLRLRLFWNPAMAAGLVFTLLIPSMSLAGAIPPVAAQNPEIIERLRVDQAFLALEFYFSLVGMLFITGALAEDGRTGALDLVLTKPVNRWRLLAERLFQAISVFTITGLALFAYIQFFYQPLPALKGLLVTLSTGIYLGMVGMTAANLTRSSLAGYGVGVLYWLFEMGSQGQFTAPFFLHMVSHQPVASNFWRYTEGLWLPNKLGLLLLAGWLFLLNGWLLDQGADRRRALLVALLSVPLVFALGWWMFPLVFR